MHEKLASALAEGSLRFVRVLWCDNANVIRGKAIHATVVRDYADHGVGITVAQQALPVMYDAVVGDTGLGPVAEVRLVPEWDTLTALPYAPGHSRVFADMVLDGRPWDLCPRTFLKRQVRLAADAGFDVMAAFENEFYLVRPTPGGFEPVDQTVFAATRAMDHSRAVVDDLTDALLEQGVPVELYYPESGPGQQELSTRYCPPLPAADRQVTYRETTHAVAARHGLRATFLPKPFEGKSGSGCHLHLSLWADGRNLFPDPAGAGGLSPWGDRSWRGSWHTCRPSSRSSRRARTRTGGSSRVPGAARSAAGGLDNREAALRVPGSGAGKGSTHFELKTVDASSNPYLALGAVIAAGLDGVRAGLDPGPPVQADPGSLPERERQARGIEPLPPDLPTAVGRLEADPVLTGALGAELTRAFVAVRRAEWEALKDLSPADEVKLLLERY